MRIAISLLALSLAFTGAACKKKNPADTAGSGSGSADMGSGSAMGSSGSADMGSGSGMAGSGSAADTAMSHQAGNCPSTVLGATTKAEVKGKDVIVTISATDKDAIVAIQKRSDDIMPHWLALQKEQEKTAGAAVHDRKGTHGGAQGICPIYWESGGKVNIKKVAKGLVVTITPKAKPEELKATIDARIAKAADWVKANITPGDQGNKGGVGGGKGDHGSDHSGSGDGKGKQRKDGTGSGAGAGTGGGGGKGTGGGSGKGSGT